MTQRTYDTDLVATLIAEVTEMLRNAEFADGQGIVLTQDCEAIEDVLAKLG